MRNDADSHPRWYRTRRAGAVIGHWIRAFWPVVVVVVVGLSVFREAVVESIESTPHPALVYGIFGVMFAAVMLSGVVLLRFVREESLLLRLQQVPEAARLACLQTVRWHAPVLPVCRAIVDEEGRRTETQLAAIEHELYAYQDHQTSALVLPGYLSGALVGLGLVGTFIGLLGTLADLAGLFSAMGQLGGQDSDPVAMFTDMLNKLQAPMRSMGTAFVASLYGLLSSLVLGLVIYSVKRSGLTVISEVRSLIRQVDSEQDALPVPAHVPHDLKSLEDGLRVVIEEFRRDHAMLSQSLMRMAADVQRNLQWVNEVGTAMRNGSLPLTLSPESMQPLVQLAGAVQTGTERLQDTTKQLQACTERLANEPRALQRLGRVPAMFIAVCSAVALVLSLSTWVHNRPTDASTPVSPQTPISLPTVPALPLATNPALESPPEASPAPQTSATPVVSIPSAAPASPSSVTAPDFQVRPGQTLTGIALQLGIPLEDLIAANPHVRNPNRVQAGQWIRVPGSSPHP